MRGAAGKLICWLAAFGALFLVQGPACAFILDLNAPPILSITAQTASFRLDFKDFIRGSRSSTKEITYRVRANNMAKGKVKGAVAASITDPVAYIELSADVRGYRNLGSPPFAALAEAKGGFKKIKAKPTRLANKTPGKGPFDLCLDGELKVAWRARLKQDAPAGASRRSLVVTLRDGR